MKLSCSFFVVGTIPRNTTTTHHSAKQDIDRWTKNRTSFSSQSSAGGRGRCLCRILLSSFHSHSILFQTFNSSHVHPWPRLRPSSPKGVALVSVEWCRRSCWSVWITRRVLLLVLHQHVCCTAGDIITRHHLRLWFFGGPRPLPQFLRSSSANGTAGNLTVFSFIVSDHVPNGSSMGLQTQILPAVPAAAAVSGI